MVAAWEATPATGVEAQDVLEIGSLFDPYFQHFCEGWAFLGLGP